MPDRQAAVDHPSIYNASWRNDAPYYVWVDAVGINDCGEDEPPSDARIFELPREMDAFEAYAYATITSGSGIRSVAAITRRYAYCTVIGESTFTHDFVSMLDLKNISLDALPYTMGIKAGIMSDQLLNYIDQLKQDKCHRSLLEYRATIDIDASSEFILKPIPDRRMIKDAVLLNGRFRGKLWSEGDVLMARRVENETQEDDWDILDLNILEWYYLDVNRDGYRDVVVLFIINSYYDWIVLTRKTSTQSRFEEVQVP